MKRSAIVILLLLFFFSFMGSKEIPVREIEVKPLHYLNSLEPKVDIIPALLYCHNFFSKDSAGSFYFVDPENHRILKFREGKLVSQIGSIGQGMEDLYHPLGIFIEGKTIYILDDGGKRIKLFSLEGKPISNFSIENALGSDALWVHKDLIFVAVRFKTKEDFNKKNLITVFNKDGMIVKSFGEIIKSSNMWSYLTFNSIYISMVDNILFGAFKFHPVIFAYSLDGKKIFQKDLTLSIKDFREQKEYREKMGFDTPMSVKDSGLKVINFCNAFWVDMNKNIYYAFSSSALKVKHVFRFNRDGELAEVIDFKFNKKNVDIINIFISEKGEFFGIGFIENPTKDAFLFKYLLERR